MQQISDEVNQTLEEIRPLLRKWARDKADTEHDIEDLFQEMEVEAWSYGKRYDPGKSATLKTWMITGARSALMHSKRGRGKSGRERIDLRSIGLSLGEWEWIEESNGPARNCRNQENRIIHRASRISLGPTEARVLHLFCEGQLTQMQIAAKAGTTRTTVSSTLGRLRKKFGAKTPHGLVIQAIRHYGWQPTSE